MPLPIRPAGLSSVVGLQGQGSLSAPGAVVKVFLGAFRRDIRSFYPGCRIERDHVRPPEPGPAGSRPSGTGLQFELLESSADPLRVSLFGAWYRLMPGRGPGFGPQDIGLIRAIGAVLELNFQILFRWSRMSLLQIRRGMPEDHYVAACLEPSAYTAAAPAPSRIAEAILTLRTMALSTYENRRVTTGVMILARDPAGSPSASAPISPPEALPFSGDLTGLKSLQRLCDGKRTLFLVDRQGRLTDIVDVRRWPAADSLASDGSTTSDACDGEGGGEYDPGASTDEGGERWLPVPCARVFSHHARATRSGGHVCLVLSPNQEIKIFAEGVQAFVFAHGRWRVLDPESKFASWRRAVANPRLARVLFQTALDLVEDRQGGLLVVVSDPEQAIGRLIAPHDLLERRAPEAELGRPASSRPAGSSLAVFDGGIDDEPDGEERPGPELPDFSDEPAPELWGKRSLHYLARDCTATTLDAPVLEALASLDGALVTAPDGRLLAFGAILRHDAHSLTGPGPDAPAAAEGARTTAALVASQFGPVLKISEDGIVSCFLDGARAWDL